MLRKPQNKTPLQEAIDQALLELMRDHCPHTDDYGKAVDQIQKLHKLKEAEKPSTLSPDTLAICLTNIAGILMIIKHEQYQVIASKALSFVLKPH